MPKLAIAIGIALVLMALGFYFGTGQESLTALIPAPIGILIAVPGVLALKESRRMHAMHVAVAIALLGALATAKGVLGTIQLLGGKTVALPQAQYERALTFVLCVILVIAGVRSFINARRNPASTSPA